MFKKILVLVLLSVFVSCGTSRSGIQTTKNGTAKTRTKNDKRKPSVNTTKDNKRTSTASNGKNTNQQSETLESTSKTVVYADVVKAYIRQYKETAKDNMKRHGVPASITLAQGILESGAGKGTLCVNANN